MFETLDGMALSANIMRDGMMGGGPGILIVLLVFLFLFLLVVGAALAIAFAVTAAGRNARAARDGASTAGGKSRAFQELEKRYARGEIDRDEFTQKKDDLN